MGVELEAKFLVPRLFSKHTGFNFLDWRRVHGLEWSLEKRVTFPLQKGAGLGGEFYKDWYVTLGSYGTSLGLGFHILKVGMTIAPWPAVLKIRWHHVSTVPGTEPGPRGSSMNKLSEQEPLLPMSMLSTLLPFQLHKASQRAINAATLAAKQSRRTHLWRVEEQI